MPPKYKIGQKVKIKLVGGQHMSPRDCAIDEYAGQIGEVTNYYWVSPRSSGEVFCIYTVRIGTGYKEIALHEDEIETEISQHSLNTRNRR